jgi:hypothetical protein
VNKVDPKYLGIPNICFSLPRKDDDREPVFSKQRMERGFDNSETWSLCGTIAEFTLPRLRVYAESAKYTYPGNLTSKKWRSILKKMIIALELITRNGGTWNFNETEQDQLEEGLDLFREYFLCLWN